MQALNILLVGKGLNIEFIKKSKYLNKLYVTSETSDGIKLTFNTFRELAQKCKFHQIDLVIVENEEWILQGIADVLKKNFVNCIAINANWINVINKSMLNKYDINTPLTLTFPEVPLVIKSGKYTKIANSLSEVIAIQKQLLNISANVAKNMYLEEFIDGEKFVANSIFDSKNLLTFPIDKLNEEQNIKLQEYSKKLENMLTDERINFVGFINSVLIWHNNNWYNIGFSFECPKTTLQVDLLFLLVLAVYQKLNEIKL